MNEYRSLLVEDDLRPFRPLDPPFNFNAANVSDFAPEVTGGYILNAILQRLGWESFAGKTLLDFGCGVRLARTVHNLNIAFGRYVGVDLHADAITWLRENLTDARFLFAHLNAVNAMYNPNGEVLGDDALEHLGLPLADAATMFSVITHQSPDEASLTFRQLHRVTKPDAFLYFTSFIDQTIDGYAERTPGQPGLHSAYHPAHLMELVQSCGWRVRSIHPQRPTMQQPVFVCVRV